MKTLNSVIKNDQFWLDSGHCPTRAANGGYCGFVSQNLPFRYRPHFGRCAVIGNL